MSAKHLMDGLTAYTDPEELASTAAQAQEQKSIILSIIVISAITIGTAD